MEGRNLGCDVTPVGSKPPARAVVRSFRSNHSSTYSSHLFLEAKRSVDTVE
jgi:hypothetical protein